MQEFRVKFEDLEVRSCKDNLTQTGEHTTAEIVKWTDEKTCYTLAYWRGLDLIFVESRPFEIECMSFMKIAEIGQKIINFYKDAEYFRKF